MAIRKHRLVTLAALILAGVVDSVAEAAPLSNEENKLQAYVGLLRSDARKAKSHGISEVMQFDAAQVAKFWRVSTEFEKEFTKIGDGSQALVKDYILNLDRTTPESATLMVSLAMLKHARDSLRRNLTRKRLASGSDSPTGWNESSWRS